MSSSFAHCAVRRAWLIVALLIATRPVLAEAADRSQASTVADPARQATAKRRTAGVEWTFRDIDVQALLEKLKRFGIEAPVALEGRVTVRLALAVPWRSLLRAGSYEIDGDVSASRLTVAGVELQALSMHLLYTEGAFELTKMSFTLPNKEGRSGSVSGTARVKVQPPGDLSAQLKIGEIPLSNFFDALPKLAGKASGTAAGQFAGQVSVAHVRDLAAWRAQGRLELSNVQAFGLPPLAASTEFQVANGRATVTNLTAQVEQARITASGNLALTAPYNFSARLRTTIPDLGWLNKLRADIRLPAAIAGSFTLDADADGSLEPKRLRLRGALNGRNLRADRLVIDRLQVPYEGTLDRMRLNSARADLYGGRIVANFSLPTQLNANFGVGVRVSDVDLGALASAALHDRQLGLGLASGTLQLQAPVARITELETWSGEGRLALRRANLYGIDVSQVTAEVRVDKGELVLDRLAAQSLLARLTGSARVGLVAPFGFGTALRMENVDLAQLNRLSVIRLRVTVGGRAGISTTARGTLQPLRLWARGGVAARGLRAENVVVDGLDLKYQADSGNDPRNLANWQARLDASWSGIHADHATLPRGSLTAGLSDGTLAISRLTSESGPMRIDASGRVHLFAPYEFALKLTANDVDVAMLNALPIRPPLAVGGVASATADLEGQLDPLKVDGTGSFGARNLRVAGASIDSLSFDFAANDAAVTLSRLSLAAYRGRLDGNLTVPLSQASQGDVDVRWQQVNVGRALADLRGSLSDAIERSELSRLSHTLAELRFEGWTWGRFAVRTPAGKLFDPAAWTGEVDISLAELRVAGWQAQKAFIRGRLADGKADLTRLAFDINQARLRGSASLELAQPYKFTSSISLGNVDLAEFNDLPGPLRPPVQQLAGVVSLSLDVGGMLEPLEITGKGSLKGDELQAGGAKVDHLVAEVRLDPKRLTLTQFHASLYDGKIEGTAQIGLKADEASRIDLAWDKVDLGRFVTDVARLPVGLKGQVEGELDVEIPAGQLGQLTAWTVEATFDTTPITAESGAVGQLRGRFAYRNGTFDYGLDGTLLRGRMVLAGRWQPAVKSGANEGRFDLSAARLDALAPLFGIGSTLSSLTGQINVNLPYRHDEKTGLPIGAGELAIDDIRLNDVSLLDEVRGVVRLGADRVEIASLQGLFADGSLTASAVAFFHPARRGSVDLDIDGAEMAQAFAPWHNLASKLRGTFDARLQAFFGGRRPTQLAGTVSVRRASARGLEFSGLRLPLAGTFDPVSGHGAIRLHGASGQLARGRFVGDFDVTLASGLDLKGHGKFTHLDLRTLLRQSATARHLANGKVDGLYTLAGRNVRTVADLTGTLRAELINAQALSLPVLQQTLPYLTGGVSGSTTFDSGELRAHLSRGAILIDRFTLASGSAQIYAEGTVSLAGRLDLNVLAKTGQLNARTQAVALLASRIALFVSPPVALLLEVTQFLSNQVINLEITGTVRSPTVRIEPLQLLGQEAARFFLYQAVP
ncbi:MAG TPA: AsmA-like C-terminal region-containing protein [Pirellulales bacterium]|nr:AsmA-like C-terminal region-containing protein [Pirellulales bacterium]